MGKLIPGKYGGKINIWEKGESGNPKGRPKKPVLQMKVEGYKLHEINDTIQAMCSMDLDQLRKIWDNPKSTVLEKTIAAALRKGIEKGSLQNVETLLDRVYGKPKEKMDITTNGNNLNEPKYVINIVKTNKDDEGNKNDTGISRPTGE
jgi:hypothetical protein